MSDVPLHPESVVVSAGRPHEAGAPLAAPIVLSAPFRHTPEMNPYVRWGGSETTEALESALGALDGGHATVYASGMAAVAAVLGTLPAGAVVVVPQNAYAGAVQIFAEYQAAGRITTRPVEITDTAQVVAALPGAALLWLETATNPMMGVCDLPALIAAAHEAGALVVVDSTFQTPLTVRPLEFGADVVMHSVTKYLSGHSDVLMGALIARDTEVHDRLRFQRGLLGGFPGALESYLALRGVRTLAVRFDRAQANAAELAQRLTTHANVTRVRYPGLPDDPGHERATKLFSGYGAMLSFEVVGGADGAERVADAVRLITHATSLGGVESLLERRARNEMDARMGVPPALLRLSVGIENVEDLWADLTNALNEASA